MIINEAPPTIWKGTKPPFFYNNPNCTKNDLFIEVMITLFLPEEYIEKTTYDLLHQLLSIKYTIANDFLVEEFGKPYLPAGGGNNKIFRQKFRKCLEGINYMFETNFSYLRNL